MTQAPGPISRWVKDTRCSQLNCERNLVTVCSPPFIPFVNASSSTDNHTNKSSIELCNNWEIHSSKARCYSSDTSPKSFLKHDKRSLMLKPKSDTLSRLRCWPAALSLLPDKLWTL